MFNTTNFINYQNSHLSLFFAIWTVIYTLSVVLPKFNNKEPTKAKFEHYLATGIFVPICLIYCIYLLHYIIFENIDPQGIDIFYRNIILEWAIAYFTIDTIGMFTVTKFDLTFVLHHIAMIIGAFITLQTNQWIIILTLFLGEMTNPFQTFWSYLRYKHPIVFKDFNMIFFVYFIFIRAMVIPGNAVYMIEKYYQDTNITMAQKHLFCVLVSCGVIGGFWWIKSLIRGLRKYYQKKHQSDQDYLDSLRSLVSTKEKIRDKITTLERRTILSRNISDSHITT